MATIADYVGRLDYVVRNRHRNPIWVVWANALLEKLSGAGILPPQRLTRGVVVRDDVWIDRPPRCRNVLELRDSRNQNQVYRFAEENNCLRVLDARFGEPEKIEADVVGSRRSYISVNWRDLTKDQLKDWLFVVTAGLAAGNSFIISSNGEPGDRYSIADVYFLNAPDSQEQENDFITAGYFVPPRDYLILSFIAAFNPVVSMSDDLGIDGCDNLVEAWFRWKHEEQAMSVSQDCQYWGGKFQAELAQFRGEMFNRVNISPGRPLAGFTRRR